MSLISEKKNACLHLTINRPDRGNSIDPPTIVRLRKAILNAQSDEQVKVIALSGSGDRDFTTGIDISSVMRFPIDGIRNLANTTGDIASLLFYGKPSIVALNGRTMGMGVVFAAAADYRLILQGSKVSMPEVNIPAFPGASCIAIMTRVCGTAWARRILMLGLPIDNNDAINANIADEIVPSQADLSKRIEQVSEVLAEKDHVVIKAIKLAVNNGLDLKYMDVLRLESKLADFFVWDSASERFSELIDDFKIQYQLTGDPNQLMEDYRENYLEN
ncbi:MAG: enoyl-CoA hydratase/isomerase family protein [Promethearchaeota archaeon]